MMSLGKWAPLRLTSMRLLPLSLSWMTEGDHIANGLKEICDTTRNFQGNPFVTGLAHLYNVALVTSAVESIQEDGKGNEAWILRSRKSCGVSMS